MNTHMLSLNWPPWSFQNSPLNHEIRSGVKEYLKHSKKSSLFLKNISNVAKATMQETVSPRRIAMCLLPDLWLWFLPEGKENYHGCEQGWRVIGGHG